MKCFITISALLAVAAAEADPAYFYGGAGLLGAPYAYGGYAARAIAPAGLYRGAIAAAPVPIARAAYAAPAAAIATPIAARAAPVAVAAPAPAAVPTIASSQTHAQDELGNYEYSYNNINSAKQEAGNSLTGVKGSYSYVDAAGVQRTTNYVADAYGYRAVNNVNIPGYAALTARIHKRSIAPIAGVAAAPIAPVTGYAAAPIAAGYGLPAPTAIAGYAGLALPAQAAIAAPAPIAPIAAPVQQIAYAGAPSAAAIPSVKTTIKLNPGHATMYRVDPAY